MDKQSAKEIINNYLNGDCNEQERALVEQFYLSQLKAGKLPEELPAQQLKAAMWTTIAAQTAPKQNSRPITTRLWPKKAIAISAAALVLILGTWMFIENNQEADLLVMSNDIAPGKNRATLRLANGQTIPLSEAKTGLVIDATALKYNDQSPIPAAELGKEIQMLAVQTPKGGQYQVLLPDGTKAWLNASSSIQFPSSFQQSKSRKVSIEGEVYFEVSKDQKHPFIVKSSNQEIEVLGTHFNVQQRAGHQITTTTLLEGRVRVQQTILQPGQQAQNRSGNIAVDVADTAAVMAWKNGYFSFHNTSIQEVMETLSSWYDIEVELDKDLNTEGFTGKFSRSRNISEVLKMLSKTGKVHFTIAGRRVIVQK